MNKKFKYIFNNLFRSKNKLSFLASLSVKSSILDVGCGSILNAVDAKNILPNSNYTGIDVTDYNSKSPFFNKIDKYIISNKNNFSKKISSLDDNYFDAVISCHNLEHCNYRLDVLKYMCKKIKKGGSIFLSFPSEKSVAFPSRNGTLNYFDDNTHLDLPPDPIKIIHDLKKYGFEITFYSREYKPLFLYLFGFFINIFSMYRNKVMLGTWEYYGFETIIHARKIKIK